MHAPDVGRTGALAGNIKAAVWQNEVERDGSTVIRHSVTFQKRYCDKASGDWKTSTSYFPDDIPRIRLVLREAYAFIVLKEEPTDEG